jgi:hypothetical protein
MVGCLVSLEADAIEGRLAGVALEMDEQKHEIPPDATGLPPRRMKHFATVRLSSDCSPKCRGSKVVDSAQREPIFFIKVEKDIL